LYASSKGIDLANELRKPLQLKLTSWLERGAVIAEAVAMMAASTMTESFMFAIFCQV
jgi:hypothetical protein